MPDASKSLAMARGAHLHTSQQYDLRCIRKCVWYGLGACETCTDNADRTQDEIARREAAFPLVDELAAVQKQVRSVGRMLGRPPFAEVENYDARAVAASLARWEPRTTNKAGESR